MRDRLKILIVALVPFLLCTALLGRGFATGAEPDKEPPIDPAPCFAAISANDDDKAATVCSTLIDNDKTAKADRIKALIGRAGAYGRRDQIDRAIADYDSVLRFDPTLADVY